MEAQATSFGWLAIRNFTYCLSTHPDPPNKPLGVQPNRTKIATLNSLDEAEKRLTGMGDSVVVLYHPEDTNRALAWCNTLVAFQSTKHVQCHTALPTCQRCDAVREKSKGLTQQQGSKGSKKPSKRLGEQKASPKEGTERVDEKGLLPLQKRGKGNNDPSDPWIPLPGDGATGQSQSKRHPQPVEESDISSPPHQDSPSTFTAGRQFGSSSDLAGNADPENDPELEAAISEFQDYCENKLTLAVRADCPLHLVRDWSDEPPFDLHRFCMSLRGSDGSTLHTGPGPGTSIAGGGNKGGQQEIKGGGEEAKRFPDPAGGNGGGGGSPKGVVDPNDPVVPFLSADTGDASKGQPQTGNKK